MTPDHEPDALLLVNEALDNLAAEAPEKAELIKLRFFAGVSIDEVASASGIYPAMAKRHRAFARARLFAGWQRMGRDLPQIQDDRRCEVQSVVVLNLREAQDRSRRSPRAVELEVMTKPCGHAGKKFHFDEPVRRTTTPLYNGS